MRWSEKTVMDLLKCLYESVTDTSQWQPFLTLLAREMSAHKAGFHIHEFSEPGGLNHIKGQITFRVGYSEEELRLYNDHFVLKDPYVRRIRSRFGNDLSIGTTADLFSKAELESSSYYAEYGRPNGIFHLTWIVLKNGNDLRGSGLSLLRDIHSDAFDNSSTDLLSTLAPHMRQMLAIQQRMTQLNSDLEVSRHALGSFGIAVVGVGESSKIVSCSAPAERYLRSEHGLTSRNGCIEALDARHNAQLQALIRGAVATASGRGLDVAVKVKCNVSRSESATVWSAPSGGLVQIMRSSRPPLQILIVPCAAQGAPPGSSPKALLFFHDDTGQVPSRSAVLRIGFKLTPAECRLAECLLCGNDLKTCAEMLGYTVESTRFLLKMVFQKMGCRRQPDLIRLLLSIPGQVAMP
jgi:DNA-binding CsgD family transcriptional regulator